MNSKKIDMPVKHGYDTERFQFIQESTITGGMYEGMISIFFDKKQRWVACRTPQQVSYLMVPLHMYLLSHFSIRASVKQNEHTMPLRIIHMLKVIH